MKRLTISLLLSLCLLFSFEAYGQIEAVSAGGSAAVTETSTTYTITKTNIVLAGAVTVTSISFTTFTATSGLFADADGDSIVNTPGGASATNSAAAGIYAWMIRDSEGTFVAASVDTLGNLVIGNDADIVADLTAGTIASDGALSGTTITGTGLISTTITTKQLELLYDANNTFDITLLDDGHTTFTTVDPDGAEADINLAPDGNVGVKTAAPAEAFTVTGNVAVVGDAVNLYLAHTSATADHDIYIYFGDDGTNTAHSIRMDDGVGAFITSLGLQTKSGVAVGDGYMWEGNSTLTNIRGNANIIYVNAYAGILLQTEGGQAAPITIDPDVSGAATVNIGVAGDGDLLVVNTSTTMNGILNFAADAQGDDDYEIALPSISALTTGLTVTFTANTANTDGATLEITSVGDIDALVIAEASSVATALATGEILAGQVVTAVFDGTNWQVTSRLANDRN